MKLRPYKVIVEHDKGVTTIKVVASSKKAAKEPVMKTEGCPERAILFVLKAR